MCILSCGVGTSGTLGLSESDISESLVNRILHKMKRIPSDVGNMLATFRQGNQSNLIVVIYVQNHYLSLQFVDAQFRETIQKVHIGYDVFPDRRANGENTH